MANPNYMQHQIPYTMQQDTTMGGQPVPPTSNTTGTLGTMGGPPHGANQMMTSSTMGTTTSMTSSLGPINPVTTSAAGPVTTAAGTAAVAAQQAQQQQQQTKELNAATLCRYGQETVQEIISRMQELFQTLKGVQPPDGKFNPALDRKPKFQELLRNIKANFKRLKVIYDKIEENFPSDKPVYFEAEILQKSAEEDSTAIEEKKSTEAYKLVTEEYRGVVEQVTLQNRHLKETIDHLRQIIWDVNTMLSMRKE